MRKSKSVRFENSDGQLLAGIIDYSPERIRAYALLTHCFTCTKDLKALVKISRGLAMRGIAVLRFDFTGLGNSQGDFLASNFSSNCRDILSAVEFMAGELSAPKILIGHSLGGTAFLKMADSIPSAQSVVTIAAPGSTQHLVDFLLRQSPEIETQGEGSVTIGGMSYRLRKQLIEDLRVQDIPQCVRDLEKPLLIFHPSQDDTLPFQKGLELFKNAGRSAAFISIEGADHLLVDQPGDAEFVARMTDAWATRYLI